MYEPGVPSISDNHRDLFLCPVDNNLKISLFRSSMLVRQTVQEKEEEERSLIMQILWHKKPLSNIVHVVGGWSKQSLCEHISHFLFEASKQLVQISFNHWSQVTLSSVSTWLGDCPRSTAANDSCTTYFATSFATTFWHIGGLWDPEKLVIWIKIYIPVGTKNWILKQFEHFPFCRVARSYPKSCGFSNPELKREPAAQNDLLRG